MSDLDEMAERAVRRDGRTPPTMEWIRHRSRQRRRRRAATRIAVAVPVLLLIVGVGLLATLDDDSDEPDVAAGDTDADHDPDPTTSTRPDTGCGADWQTVDVGPFSFELPADMVDQQAQGIDSLVGNYRGESMDAYFDYGAFSSEFSELDPFDPIQESVVIDGYEGRRITADVSGSDGWDGDFITALHLPIAPPDDGFGTALSMWFLYDDEAMASTAACVTTTIEVTAGPGPTAGLVACADVAAFTDEFLDTGFIYDRGPASRDPEEHTRQSEGVVVGRIMGAEQRLDHDRPGVAILIDVSDVLWQSNGPLLEPGELAVDQEFVERKIDGAVEANLPVGARVVAFMYHADTLPDGWGFNLEGLWIECGTGAEPTLGGDIIRTEGWTHFGTVDDLVTAVREATTATG